MKFLRISLFLLMSTIPFLDAFQPAGLQPKDNSVLRVISYNVHYWMTPKPEVDALDAIVKVIEKVNPDIALLQEVSPSAGFGNGAEFKNSAAMNKLRAIGFNYFHSCNTLLPPAWQGRWFGNVIASKVPLMQMESRHFKTQNNPDREVRCYLKTIAQLPGGQELSLYNTHLEWYPHGSHATRTAQIAEVLKDAKDNGLLNKNVIIAADYNASRNSEPIQLMEKLGFKDGFTMLGLQAYAPVTHVHNYEIDFLYLSPGWNLPLANTFVYQQIASDHYPVVLDIKLPTAPSAKPSASIKDDLFAQLIQAIQLKDIAKVDELIKKGANLAQKTQDGFLPYELALQNNSWQIAGLIKDWALQHKIAGALPANDPWKE